MISSRFSWLLSVLLLLSACADSGEKEVVDLDTPAEEGDYEEDLRVFSGTDTLFQVDYNGTPIDVQLHYPEGRPKATLLILQGWSFPINDWCDSTELCDKALASGYALVCPDMGKSIYTDQVYPETRADWLQYPTRDWLITELIVLLQQKENMFLGVNDNFVVGLSTGARGALLVAMDSPEIFKGVACLSGDYDQSEYPNDNLYKGFFGSKNKFEERWVGHENPMSRIEGFEVPVYIGHGSTDNVVPVRHSEILYNALMENGSREAKFSIVEGGGHNYAYWNSEVDSILNFFDEKCAK